LAVRSAHACVEYQEKGLISLVAGEGFEPSTSGL
jgi:hypothetical protein